MIDISRRIEPGMEIYPGDPEPVIELALSRARGDLADVTRLELGAHTGTHVDAPVHFLDGGAGVEGLPLDALIGPAQVVDAGAPAGALGTPALEALALPGTAKRILFRNAPKDGLSDAASRHLLDRGVRLVGVDELSVGGEATHRALLGAGVVILEGLDLSRAAPGPWRLVCLPLLIPGADGAPARAVLEPLPGA